MVAILLVSISMGLTDVCYGQPISKTEYNALRDRATAEYESARAQCDQLMGNRKHVCVAEAKAIETRRKAEAEVEYRSTDKALRDARVAVADADFDVAKRRCSARTGNENHVCVAEADAARRKAKVDAEAAEKVAAIRSDADEQKRDADYDVAIQRCNLLGGASKDACVIEAKLRFGKQ